ncbi:MAG: hypothetical protein RBT87_08160, partial [bacterium]|nr:hypothetical protein [bacterium]
MKKVFAVLSAVVLSLLISSCGSSKTADVKTGGSCSNEGEYRCNGDVCQATIIFTVNDNYFYRLKLLKNTSKIKEQILNYFRFFRFSF